MRFVQDDAEILQREEKLFKILAKKSNTKEEKNWLKWKFKEYKIKNSDISELKIRMDIIPVSLAIAQAALETGWGESRFANEANNLFGIRTWNQEDKHLIPMPASVDPAFKTVWPGWGVKVYETKCDSVKDYMRIINEVFAYAEFREMRGDGETDALVLARTLKRWAAEDHYTDLIEDVIKYNIRGKYDL